MRISDLAGATGVPVATIKYYLRAGLLPAGTATAANQARYGPGHVRRLRLIRTLREVGGLGIERIHRILTAIDDEDGSRHALFTVATEALEPVPTAAPSSPVAAALEEIDGFVRARGWRVRPDAATRRALAEALVALRTHGRAVTTDVLVPYADLADRLAAREVASIPADAPASVAVEEMVVGTVIFERVLTALRRMAHEHHSASRDERPAPAGPRG